MGCSQSEIKVKENKPMNYRQDDQIKSKENEPIKNRENEPIKKGEVEPIKNRENEPIKNRENDPIKNREVEQIRTREVEPLKKGNDEQIKNEENIKINHMIEIEKDLRSGKFEKIEYAPGKRVFVPRNREDVIRIEKIYHLNDDHYGYESKKAQLITMSNRIPKNITCTVEFKTDYNDEEDYYYLTPNGAEEIPNADLQYGLVYFPVKDRSLILDFKDRSNTKVKDNKVYKTSSGGLSTGGIVAVAVPTCAVLLGVAGLSFYLSRNNSTPPPQIKTMSNMNMQNNTMGVIANSSEAVIHQ